MINMEEFKKMEPMKYYQPLDYKSQKAIDMMENRNNNYIATWKNDGEWARIIKCGEEVIVQSRSISKKTGEYGDKTALVPHIVEEVKKLPFENLVLLGELCFDDITKTSKDVGSILRCLPNKAVERQKVNKLYFKVFDCLCKEESLMDKGYADRFAAAQSVCESESLLYIGMTKYMVDGFEDFLQDILARGGEGIVIHSKDYKYAAGKRPAWSTMKVKKIVQEIELQVIGTIEPHKEYEGKEIDTWQYFEGDEAVTKPYYMGWKNGIVVDNNGTAVNVSSGLTDDDREWLASTAAQELIEEGQLYAVCSCMEITESGSMRHPRLIRLRTEK